MQSLPPVNIHEVLQRQYRASLEMLSHAVTQCPEALWLAAERQNRFWHIAYHAVFFTHLYLQPSEAEFRPWARHRPNYQFLGTTPWPPYERPTIDAPYSQADVLEYRDLCLGEIETRVPAGDLDAPSGFPWLRFSRLEVHLYNIRHLQHHAAQLIDRLRTGSGIGIGWVGSVPRS